MPATPMTHPLLRVLLLFLVLGGRVAVAQDNWPEFRGPHGDGHADAAALPLTWSETEHVRWKTPIHDRGWSSPVIWGDQIWLTTATTDGKQLFALCGRSQVGRHRSRLAPVRHRRAGLLHPLQQLRQLHAGHRTGSRLRTFRLGRHRRDRYGHRPNALGAAGSSLRSFSRARLIADSLAQFVDPDVRRLRPEYLVALDKQTGETVWRTDRNIQYETDDGDFHKAFSTPTVIQAAGREQLISPSAAATIAYDPATGRELWRVRCGGMNAAARPLFGQGLVFATTAAGGWQLFAVRPDGLGDTTDSHVAWKSGKSIPSRSSPLLVGDRLFMVSDAGVASCVDAKTGDQLWQKRIAGEYAASPHLCRRPHLFFQRTRGIAPSSSRAPNFASSPSTRSTRAAWPRPRSPAMPSFCGPRRISIVSSNSAPGVTAIVRNCSPARG